MRFWWLWLLCAAAFGALFGPALVGNPGDSAASPFCTPLWTDRKAPMAREHRFSLAKGTFPLRWTGPPPENMALEGRLTFPGKPDGKLLWELPSGETLLLQRITDTPERIDMDARDLMFRKSLGVGLLGDAMPVLFPTAGTYRIRYEGEPAPLSAQMRLSLAGSRYGLLGTDQQGRDVFRLFVAGLRVSLMVGIAATLLATTLGLAAGLLSGYLGGVVDSAVMRLVDLLLSIPVLPIMMVLTGFWGKGLWQLVLILGGFAWMGTARVVRSMALTLREAPFVEELNALGAPTHYILRRHLVPEAMPLLLAQIALGVPGAILAETGLSFLGLTDPRVISWGRMLHEAHAFGAFSAGAWWLILPPGVGITLLCLAFMHMGRFLEERTDPRLRRGGMS